MKKIITSLFIITLLFMPSWVNAQDEVSTPSASENEEFNFEKAYKDYTYKMGIYRQLHSEYLLARSQYLQAKTLASKTKARDATAKMLAARDDALITYLTTLRMRLREAEGVAEPDRESLYTQIDTEISWYQSHMSQLASAGTLEDLVKDSEEAKAHFTFTEPLIFQVLIQIPIGKMDVFVNDTTSLLTRIKDKTNEIRERGDHDVTLTERWIIETENKVNRGLDKKIEAQTKGFSNLQLKVGKPVEVYETVLTQLTESLQFMKESSNYMKEIVRQLRTKE